MKYSQILILFFSAICFSLPLMSAAGLELVNGSASINKVVGQDYFVNLTIKNTQSFSFYNISFEDNPYISITKIAQLEPGKNISIAVRVFNDNSFIKSFRLRGFYNSTIGPARLEYNFDITKSTLDRCDSYRNFKEYNLVEGDTLKITNKETGSNLLVYTSDGTLFTTISPLSSAIITNSVLDTDIRYRLAYSAHQSSQVESWYCYMNTKWSDDTGLVNRQDYDAIFNITSEPIYQKTNVTTTFIETNYTTNFYSSQDGLFSIKNTGDLPAYNIRLSGNWMTFSVNNFSLEVGQTKTVSYTIKPSLSNTSDTNKTYSKIMYINGNFDEIRQEFFITIPYAEINSNLSASNQGLIEFITQYCAANPTICNTEPRIIYMNVNDSDNLFNATLGEKQLREFMIMLLEHINNQQIVDNYYKEALNNMTVISEQNSNRTNKAYGDLAALNNSYSGMINAIIFVMITIFIIGTAVCGWYLVNYYKKKKIEGASSE